MIISRNLSALNINRITNANISAHSKSTEKVSSGYRINLAVDNPVGLAMSETMRRQIRGLMQGTNNTKDGVAFVQIADGAMSEIHDMLQRMNELSIKAADGLCTAVDRAALNAELDQLRTEIDRINSNTAFNELQVFEEHETSYYQICGNKQWSDNERHTITESANELNIHLPDGYVPKDYTITVPTGTYTTQELMDEIDDALNSMSPSNPGFVFEYTSDGYCNLNFESAEGKPTKIEFVDGALAYLIYDFETGGSPATLLGTTEFGFDSNGNPSKLAIRNGENDVLGFYAESAEGSQYISMKLEPKSYTCDELIDTINSKLDEIADTIPIAAGIKAEKYENNGKYYIQITGGDTINIVGLKGNMFQYELNSRNPASSVFYDNTIYSNCVKYPASITGNRHLDKYPMTISAQNNILKFKVNNSIEYTITIPLGNGNAPIDYTVSEIVSIINDQLGNDAEITASGTSQLVLTNKLTGSKSTLDFESYFVEDPVYQRTYETLFCSTSGESYYQPGRLASLTGAAAFNGSISVTSDAPLNFYVNVNGINKPYSISSLKGDYANLDDLITTLNNAVGGMDIAGKILFEPDDYNCIRIISDNSPDVTSISITDKNDTYMQLFTGKREVPNWSVSSTTGSSTADQGQTVGTNVPASTTVSSCQQSFNIDGSNNKITISLAHGLQNSDITIELDGSSYSIGDLVSEIERKLGADSGITVSSIGNSIRFEYTPSAPVVGDTWTIGTSGSAWNSVCGTRTVDGVHTSVNAQKATLTSFSNVPDRVVIDSSNNTLDLTLDIFSTVISDTLVIPDGDYSRQELINALKSAIDGSNFQNIVTVGSSGTRLLFSAGGKTFEGSGSFYNEVMCKGDGTHKVPTKGRYSYYYDDTLIIGRTDLTKEPVKIIKDVNDQLTFDFTYPGADDHLEITITLPSGEYLNGVILFGDKEHPSDELKAIIKKQIDNYDKDDPYYDEIQRLFGQNGCFDLNFTIGGYKTNAENNVDSSALQISATPRKGANVPDPDEGQYILDGVRGSAAPFVFYKTTSLPTASFIIGTKNVMGGITIEPGKNVLTLSANSVPYQYTFTENTYYTADEFINLLNSKFKKGDDYGNPAPLQASLENGAVKISHKIFGANTITDISGSARSTIFFEEEGRDEREPLIIQVGSEKGETIELPRIIVNSCSLGINSITLSTQKYADKAIKRIKGAINLLNSRRSTYGAMQNRLEHTINNNENVTESVQKTESIIRDTDISSEMIRYSNLSILLQAGQNAIAESNKKIEKLLSILQ